MAIIESMFLILSNFYELFKIQGTPLQFGASPLTGCPDGSFSLRTLLQMRQEHDIESWDVFADLVKAFDSIHRELMFELLK